MRLGISEVRERAERFDGTLEEEIYRTRAGLKTRPEFRDLFDADPVLSGPDVIPSIERQLAEADGEEERCLRYLLEWAANFHMRSSIARLDDEYWAWEASSALEQDGRALPLRQMALSVASEGERSVRLEQEVGRNEMLEELIPMQIDRVVRARDAMADLGYGNFVEAKERLCGFSVRNLADEMQRFLDETRDVYYDLLGYQLSRYLDVTADQADVTDRRWLSRMDWLDENFDRPRVIDRVHQDLREIGLLSEDGLGIERDFESRPLKRAGSFCAPIRIPGRAIICLAPTGGRPDCASYLHELGLALHCAHTDPELLYEYRALGDASVNEAIGVLFYRLMQNRAWLQRVTGLEGSALEDYLVLAEFLDLCRLRRNAAILTYELMVLGSSHASELADTYVELLLDATGFRHDPRTYLEHVDPALTITRIIRGDMLASVLQTALCDQYDEDWYRNPAAGEFLETVFAAGRRHDAVELALQWSGERLGVDSLLRLEDERLA